MSKIKKLFPWILCVALLICLIYTDTQKNKALAKVDRIQEDLDYAMEHAVPAAYQRGLRESTAGLDEELEHDLMLAESDNHDLSRALAEARSEAEENYREGYQEGYNDAVYYSFEFLYEHGLGGLDYSYDLYMDEYR